MTNLHEADRFRHEALLYANADQFVAGTVPFIRDGIRAGEPVLVVESVAKIEILREALGGDGEAVMFADMAGVGANPARIIPAWQDFVSRHEGATRLRGIGEPIWKERTPDELIVSVVQGDRVFVMSAPAKARIDRAPACEEIWQEALRKAAKSREANEAPEQKDDKLSEQATRTEEEGDAAFRRCFAQRAKEQGFFAALTKQAQALVDGLPSR